MARKGKLQAKAVKGNGDKDLRSLAVLVVIASVSFYVSNLYLASGPKLSEYQDCSEASDLSIIDLPKAIVSDALKKLDAKCGTGFAKKMDYKSSVKGVATSLMKCGNAFQVNHPNYVTGSFVICYILLQTFAIPGPIILSVLAGVFYDSVFVGVGIVASCCAFGSSMCYLLSYFLGKRALFSLIPSRMEDFSNRIESNRESLFWYMLFLRLTPLLPNWFINVASPLVGVPLWHFAMATFLGTTPANVVYYYAGTVLKDQGEFDTSKGYKSVVVMTLLAVLSLVPTFFKKQIAQMEKDMGAKKEKTAVKKASATKKQTANSGTRRKTRSSRAASKKRK